MRNSEAITILDCTLRDGGHLTDGYFGEQMIRSTIRNLVAAKVDIIEVGFLMEQRYNTDTARFKTIADVKRVLPLNKGNSKFSLMADFIDVSELEPYDGTIDFIRLSFKRQRLNWGLNAAKILMDKGYKCFINPVNCNIYSDSEYIQMLQKVNELKPYGFSIVDTFGVLRKKDLSRIYYLTENNLDPDICIGLHLHENLGYSLLLAQHFIEIHEPMRKINIDASLLGMGRAPGNLCIEQIMELMNERYGGRYVLEPVLDIINDYIEPLKEEKQWGYSVPYFLSAKYHLHRTYAEYLMGKWKLGIKDIQRILSQVDSTQAEYFNEEYIEELYKNYISIGIDDNESVKLLKHRLDGKDILIIAPGSSIEKYKGDIISFSKKTNVCTISVGFSPDFMEEDFVWITSVKRYNQFDFGAPHGEVIITSNLIRDANLFEYVLNYNHLLYHDDVANDDSVLLLLNFIRSLSTRNIYIAGFDGFSNNENNFYGEMTTRQKDYGNINRITSEILNRSYSGINLQFITPTLYKYGKNNGKENET